MQILNALQMNRLDEYAIRELGIPQFALMERAAEAVCNSLFAFEPCRKILVVCGIGNCAGDGIAAARILKNKGYAPIVWLVKPLEKCKESVHHQIELYKNVGGIVTTEKPVFTFDLIIDAVFGVGLNRPLDEEFTAAVEFINSAKEKGTHVVSVDLPSGIHTDTGAVMGDAVKADLTVSFSYCKPGLLMYPGREYAGKVKLASIGIDSAENLSAIGIPAEGERFSYADGFGWIKDCTGSDQSNTTPSLRKRNPAGNKGTFHRVLLIAGSKDMGGAALLSAESALRSGCGLVDVFTHERNRDLVLQSLPEAIVHTYSDDVVNEFINKTGSEESAFAADLDSAIKAADVVVMGPGLSTNAIAEDIVRYVLTNCDKPLVIDADAVNIISKTTSSSDIEQNEVQGVGRDGAADLKTLLKNRSKTQLTVMTPHPGELSRFTKKLVKDLLSDYENELTTVAKEYNLILVGKGNPTIVTDGKDIYYNLSGNDAMATAGSGDVLSGMLGAFLLNENTPFEGTTLAVYAHGLSGEEAAKEKGHHAAIAGDFIKSLHKVLLTMVLMMLCILTGTFAGCKKTQNFDPVKETELSTITKATGYEAIFLSMYGISGYTDKKFISDRGLNTYIAYDYHPQDDGDLESALAYIDKNHGGEIYKELFVGIDPVSIDLSAKKKTFAEQLTSHHFEHYSIFLPAYPMEYWTALTEEDRQNIYRKYTDLVAEFDGCENVDVYYYGNQAWIVNNPAAFQNGGYELTECAAERMFLYTICSALYKVDANSIEAELKTMEELVQNAADVKANYEEKELAGQTFIFLGDSIFGLYEAPHSIPGVFEDYSGAKSYNCGIGGMCMAAKGANTKFETLLSDMLNPENRSFSDESLDYFAQFSAEGNWDHFRYAKEFLLKLNTESGNGEYSLVMEFGLNDYFTGIPVNDFRSSYEESIEKIVAQTGNDVRFRKMYLFVPGYIDAPEMQNGDLPMSDQGGTLEEYREAVVEIAKKYNFTVIDLRDVPGMEQENVSKYLLDGVHYNEAGRYEIALYFENQITK
jgi:NAD(P)H-hydrate epimerase